MITTTPSRFSKCAELRPFCVGKPESKAEDCVGSVTLNGTAAFRSGVPSKLMTNNAIGNDSDSYRLNGAPYSVRNAYTDIEISDIQCERKREIMVTAVDQSAATPILSDSDQRIGETDPESWQVDEWLSSLGLTFVCEGTNFGSSMSLRGGGATLDSKPPPEQTPRILSDKNDKRSIVLEIQYPDKGSLVCPFCEHRKFTSTLSYPDNAR